MAMDPMICVVLQNMTGERLELEVSLKMTVRELKRQIARYWSMPRLCQRLLLGNKFLDDDSEALAEHLEGSSTLLALTVVASRPATSDGVLAERLAMDALQEEGFEVLKMLRGTRRFLNFSVQEKGSSGGESYVAKAISLQGLDERTRVDVQQEVATFEAIAVHPNLAAYCQNFLDDTGEVLFTVMSHSEGKELRSAIGKAQVARQSIPGPTIMRWTSQLLAGLRHLHTRGVLHRDLTPSNILLCEGEQLVRIGEFGISQLLDSQVLTRMSDDSSVHYLAPELILNESHGVHTDMWAIGCILFELCTLQLPFEGRSIFEFAMEVAEKDPDWSLWRSTSELQDAAERLLCKHASGRPTAASLLADPLFSEQSPARRVWGEQPDTRERTPDPRLASSPLYHLVAGDPSPKLLSPVKGSTWVGDDGLWLPGGSAGALKCRMEAKDPDVAEGHRPLLVGRLGLLDPEFETRSLCGSRGAGR
uniref:non-specific serine/threonine protein kinase n=1 Tax=Alexandrium catenella TaxID=2925 RepID=A0A7S1W5L3_ALECA